MSLRCIHSQQVQYKIAKWQWKPAALSWIPLKGATETHLAILTNSVCRVEVVQTLGAHRLTVLLILGRKTPRNKGVGLGGQSCQGSTLNRWERWSCMDTAYWREQNSSIRTQHQPKRRFTWDIISFTWLPSANAGLYSPKQNNTATKTHRLTTEIQWARNSSILFASWAWQGQLHVCPSLLQYLVNMHKIHSLHVYVDSKAFAIIK